MNVFREAINVLDRDGWCQGAAVNDQGEHCIRGAIGMALTGEQRQITRGMGYPYFQYSEHPHFGSFMDAVDTCQDVIVEQYPDYYHLGLAEWNDTPGRTKAEVVMVLEKAALKSEEIW